MSTVETANKGVMAAAITSPWWLPWVKSISDAAALILPIAALLWIAVQAIIKIHVTYFRKR